ncbi:hypothetical protein [Caminibacter pacificus]|uniref:Uncharacterized protein n=1 Tax=Caminibacter pacificus TaxID=1424653 RepID=A0AAJ4RAL1_9BACT|nr:hypothetical protein [Caminibacter pacificus]QDD68191.1 hypothetical protein C6V80_10070 [Caminibacter pacificus]ROR38704.1 hypothetical protein EDC58_1919 [Caminibacter pacificus]
METVFTFNDLKEMTETFWELQKDLKAIREKYPTWKISNRTKLYKKYRNFEVQGEKIVDYVSGNHLYLYNVKFKGLDNYSFRLVDNKLILNQPCCSYEGNFVVTIQNCSEVKNSQLKTLIDIEELGVTEFVLKWF